MDSRKIIHKDRTAGNLFYLVSVVSLEPKMIQKAMILGGGPQSENEPLVSSEYGNFSLRVLSS